MAKITAEEAKEAGLSQEEIDAINGDETEDEDILSEIAGDDEDGEDQDGDDDGDEEADQDGDKNEPGDDESVDAGNDEGADDLDEAVDNGNDVASDADDFDPNDVPAVSFTPRLSGEISEKYEKQIEALDAKLDEGEISQAEHRKEVRKLEAASQNEEISSQQWAAEQSAFFKLNGNYAAKTNPVLWGTLNQEVIRLANDKDNEHLSGIQLLYKAKHNVEKAFKAMFPGQAPAKKDDGKQDAKPKADAKPKVEKKGPKTLAGLPAADSQDTSGDKFAALDKLDGMDLERALAKMSEADRQAYLEGAY